MDLLIEYALGFVGRPYIWGGSGLPGFDCSGLVQELLKFLGACPPGDSTAQGLFDHFEANARQNSFTCGALAFFGESVTRITHVGMLLNSNQMIEAGGGNSTCTSPEMAAKLNAFVRIRPIKSRKDLVAVLRPSYPVVGLM